MINVIRKYYAISSGVPVLLTIEVGLAEDELDDLDPIKASLEKQGVECEITLGNTLTAPNILIVVEQVN